MFTRIRQGSAMDDAEAMLVHFTSMLADARAHLGPAHWMTCIINRRIATAAQFIVEHLQARGVDEEATTKRIIEVTRFWIAALEGVLVCEQQCMHPCDYALSNTHERISTLYTGLVTLLQGDAAAQSSSAVAPLEAQAQQHLERVKAIRDMTVWL
jgi:hypothetical protein